MRQETIIAQAVIDTPRFVLRPIRKSDAGLMTMYASDRRVADMTSSIPHPLPPGTVELFITSALDAERTEHVWVMDASEDGGSELLGVISLKQMDRNQSEIGYWIAPGMWNTGLASEAVAALVAANPLGNTTVFGSVFQDNPASARVLTNAGFDYLGDAEAFSVARGAKVATWTYLKKLQ
ncbi:GNAT family N-acetyltransferase [Roseobacter sp. HKCCD9010]|uniref:GNAT family N-acetyltransferase n=1 Tax=unclassified Roseobacter TaxID=196798 RepID=UPI0014916936|nr:MULTISPECIES: GNAT family N-acetyltransferase [unclassified Roseobacter]MBF9050336.1 GNAT family N-acetyltransferase [Rhodobacterales bacterium HKCCD4356]NNV12579.1 GNAT family N-acetyltransferase [Roseobacter sp. HKCCD7357]NNV15956.1 GNAT family N-acetyltransferase [Roseobacter sp. HKCCD8768]NNV25416.1 GNAT family N-acetyltransferase [Roseobacter sp. HKCCD8192]NNV29673.1 GNAT family N-acetyltransferase [Roseobacter sp. HKCCD9061]